MRVEALSRNRWQSFPFVLSDSAVAEVHCRADTRFDSCRELLLGAADLEAIQRLHAEPGAARTVSVSIKHGGESKDERAALHRRIGESCWIICAEVKYPCFQYLWGRRE